MTTFRLLLLLCNCLFIAHTLAEDTPVEKVFKDLEVIPDVVDVAPNEFLILEFANGLMVGEGEEFTPTQTKDEPKLSWSAEPDAYYTVLMINPDIPSRQQPLLREWLHWLVVNVPGMDVCKGEVLDPYIGPMAPKMSGLLRYVFLVYKQPDKLTFAEPVLNNTNIAGHQRFSSMKFSAKYNLGSPVAGNVFQARWDELVPELHKQFGIVI